MVTWFGQSRQARWRALVDSWACRDVSEENSLCSQLDGYFAEGNYPSGFHPKFSPAWIDSVLHRAGIVAPRDRRWDFRLVDVGCGDGTGLVLLAAAYPDSEFLGIDAMPEHIAAAEALTATLGLTNVRFLRATFGADAIVLDAPFDYIVCQGVIAWVSARVRAAVFAFAGAWLAPGGAAVFGYNAQPGWLAAMALQRLLRAFGETLPGTPVERFMTALDRAETLAATGVVALPVERIATLRDQLAAHPATYYPHEYFNRCWSPLWSGDVHAELAALGLHFAGEAGLLLDREDFCLRKAQRAALGAITDPFARATAKDIVADTSFRVDCFTRDAIALDDPAAARLDQWVGLSVTADRVAYEVQLRAGLLRFDNEAARAIVAAASTGPIRLADVAIPVSGNRADILNAADLLLAAQQAHPVDPPTGRPGADRVNDELARRGSGGRLDLHGPVG